MKSVTLLSAIAAAASVQASPALNARASMESITTSGNAFFKGSTRFYVRGIDYQPGGASADIDPLADTKVCKPDIEKFKKLGINAIRVYSVDNSLNHDDCMNALADAGIYVMIDANNPKYSINRADPHPSYNAVYLQSVFATIDAFAKYPNTMAFFSGNEVIHDEKETTLAAKYVKATDRDMRAYIKARGYRKILVGYSAADVTDNRLQTAAFFNCGTEEERSDFFAFNDYSWCTSDFVTSGWDQKVKNFTGYGLPIFLSEYGCIANTRNFREIESLMHQNMTHVYSGGLMYEYSMEPNDFGIVKIKGGDVDGGVDQTGDRQELQPEFNNLVSAMKKYPPPTGDGGYSKERKVSECPKSDDHWMLDGGALPDMPVKAKQYFDKGAGKGPGLKGTGSQWAADSASTSENGVPTDSKGQTKGGSSNNNQDKNAGVRGQAPYVVSGVVALMTVLGFAL